MRLRNELAPYAALTISRPVIQMRYLPSRLYDRPRTLRWQTIHHTKRHPDLSQPARGAGKYMPGQLPVNKLRPARAAGFVLRNNAVVSHHNLMVEGLAHLTGNSGAVTPRSGVLKAGREFELPLPGR